MINIIHNERINKVLGLMVRADRLFSDMRKLYHSSISALLILAITIGCSPSKKSEESSENATYKSIGSIEKLDDRLDDIISSEAKIEILTDGFTWSEGPVWVESLSSLLFTDVPQNTIWKWNEAEGKTIFIKPSGYTGYAGNPKSNEPGANGLALDKDGNLIMAQHGDRRLARFNGDLNAPESTFETIADKFNGLTFNSPNDLVQASSGLIYFTDPPYGLNGQDEDSLKQIEFNGVYSVSPEGNVNLVDASLTRPNGIALSPDEKTLYVANSDTERAIWMAYDITEDGVTNGRLFFDATSSVPDKKGLPDGLKVNTDGIIFATGPGGVLVFSPEGDHLGTINTTQPTANCALSPDEKTLYMTANNYLTRVSLK